VNGFSEADGNRKDPALPLVPASPDRGAVEMANIGHEAVLSAAWMLMRRAREASSAMDRSDTSGHAAEITQGGRTYTKEAVRKLIATYLYTPTHISSTFPSW